MHRLSLIALPSMLIDMPRLADTQATIAHAMISGSDRELPDSLFGSPRWDKRFRIHIRNYQASLTSTLIQKYPATEWLLGSTLLASAAGRFVQTGAPITPCIAEYGEDFPSFLARSQRMDRWAYIESFSRLDWLLGKASIAVDEPSLRWSEISVSDLDALVDTRLTLQPGTQFLAADHPVDDVILAYLADKEPPTSPVPAGKTFIEIRGSRGAFSLARIDPGEFEFRRSLYSGLPVGEAAIVAMDIDPKFDPGRALRSLADAGYIAAMELVS